MDIQLSPLSGLYVGAGQDAQYSNPWCTTRWQLHCLSDGWKLFAAVLDQQIRPLLEGEIRRQPAVLQAPPLPAQTMPLIHSLLTIRLFDITLQRPTHSFSLLSLFPSHSTFHQRECLKEKWVHHVNEVVHYIRSLKSMSKSLSLFFHFTFVNWTGFFFFFSSCSIWLSV